MSIKNLQPTIASVTHRAFARSAPATLAAEKDVRWIWEGRSTYTAFCGIILGAFISIEETQMVIIQRSLYAVIFVVVFLISGALGSTVSVMQDGTGDFEEIQPALNAISSGDTLIIGPGEYLESNPTQIPGYPWLVDVFCFVPVAELTIIGAGADETVIGPMVYEGSNSTYSPKGVVWLEGTTLHLTGVTIRNCYEGIHTTNAPIYIDECHFFDNRYGVIWFSDGDGGGISNSIFESGVPGLPSGITVLGNGFDIQVSDCHFDEVGATFNSIQNTTIARCHIQNAASGIKVESGASCIVEESSILDCWNVGIRVNGSYSVCEVKDSEISGDGSAVYVDYYCEFYAHQSIFSGGYWSIIEFDSASSSVVSDCSLFPGSGPAIRSFRHPSYGEVIHDLRNNYWGTEDGDEITALILDGVNDPENTSTVLFEPFVGGPVATKATSLDGLKAMYR